MSQIENVSDTARWVAAYRAMETARPDAIFRDPFAARLAGEKGEAIVDSMKRGRQMSWAMVVRTAVFDEIIRERIRNGGADQVVNLAAGLDTRAWRMTDLPASLRWVDVDLPGILDHKLSLMQGEKTVCHYEGIRADLREPAIRHALFTQLGAAAKRTLVITEGLLIYLTPEQVGALASDLHVPRTFQWWLLDIASPQLLEIMKKYWAKNVTSAPFLFAPAEGTKFFEQFGWTEIEFRSTMDEAHRLEREMPMAWLWRILGRLRSKKVQEQYKRFSGNVLLERM